MAKAQRFPPDSPKARAEASRVRVEAGGQIVVNGVTAPFRIDLGSGSAEVTFVDRNKWRCLERSDGSRIIRVSLDVLLRAAKVAQEVRRECCPDSIVCGEESAGG